MPQPDGPSSEKNSPLPISSDTSSTAATSSNVFLHTLEDDGLRAERHCDELPLEARREERASAVAVEQAEIEDRVESVGSGGEPPTRSLRVDSARDGAVLATFVEQADDPVGPRPVALLDERPKLLVVAKTRPHLVPERGRLLELGVDRPKERALGALGARREGRELGVESDDAKVLGVRERRAKQLLASGEVVVDERAGHARLLGHGADPEVARPTGDDHTTRRAQDLVDSRSCCRRRRSLLGSRHPQYPD